MTGAAIGGSSYGSSASMLGSDVRRNSVASASTNQDSRRTGRGESGDWLNKSPFIHIYILFAKLVEPGEISVSSFHQLPVVLDRPCIDEHGHSR